MAVFGLSEDIQARIAEELYEAEKSLTPIPLLSKQYPVITLADAYAIQKKGLSLRLEDGACVIGRKIGITSKGVMQMLECTSPDYGYLLEQTQVPEGGSIVRAEMSSPIVEGEIAFIMGKDLDTSSVTADDIIAATTRVVPCIEVCDMRFPDWNITVRDIIADNAGTGRFMLSSSSKSLCDIDPAAISMVMEKNGNELWQATGSEVMGSPINSVVWLANKLLEYGDHLQAGDVVLSGSFMAADPALAGDIYTVKLEGFAPLTLSFE